MLSTSQMDDYSDEGYVFVPELLPVGDIRAVIAELPELCALQRPEVIFENDSQTVRSLMNVHTYSTAADKLIRNPLIIDPVKQILGSDVYVFQCVLNLKRAFTGDIWQWHQDFSTYLIDDGMPANRLVNVLIFMDEVNEFNGPLMLVPGSHRGEAIKNDVDDATTSYPIRALDNSRVASAVEVNGIVAPKGPAGSVIFANTNIIHGSASNVSPWDRVLISLTLNSVENKHQGSSRPEWVVMNNFSPV
ncbi:MAG: phytanoyl-CoA dioxygenase family protein [Gammaproteobacteria bacterium]|nr:phytanoyl-CoA dioxygenase family protein [Gammaproteobacteria bacterium]